MLRGVAGFAALLLATAAQAQVSGRVAVVSDHRYRGVSLSDGRPAAQLGVAWDHAQGWYAGAFASSARLAPAVGGDAQLMAYAGRAWRLHDGLSMEAGADYLHFAGADGYDYPGLYLGLASARLGGRVHLSRHPSADASLLHAELNASHALSARVRLLAQLGWLRRGDGEHPQAARFERERHALRLGVATDWRGFDLSLAWERSGGHGGGPLALYPGTRADDRGGWVLGMARSW